MGRYAYEKFGGVQKTNALKHSTNA